MIDVFIQSCQDGSEIRLHYPDAWDYNVDDNGTLELFDVDGDTCALIRHWSRLEVKKPDGQ